MIRYVLSTTGAALLLATFAYAQESPPLRAAVDGTFAPHAFPNLSGGYQGFNIDLANEIAKRLKRKIMIDAAQFSEGYLNTDFQFLIRKGSPKVVQLEDLKGKTISVNKGSAYDSWARELEGKIGWKVESFGTQTDAVQAVLVGRADANVAGNTVIAWAVKNNPQLELSYLYSTGLVWAAPLRKDSSELRKALDVGVECMKLDGTIAKMHEKWFGVAPAAGSAAVTVFPGYGVPDMPGYDPTAHTPSCS